MQYSATKQNKKFVVFLLMVISTISIAPLSADPTEVIAVTVSPAKYEQRSPQIKTSGRISHKNEIRLSFKTGGIIKQINVEEGDFVVAGQLLASLDLEEIEAQLLRAESNYKKTTADLKRFSSLYTDKLVSLQVKQTAQSANDSAAAELQIAKFNKKLSVIRAPADGYILKRFVESSELVQHGQAVLLMAAQNQGSILRVGLIDQDIVKVAVGDPATILIDAYPDREFTGSVSEIALSANSGAGTFEVEIMIEDQGIPLRSGLIARVAITPSITAHEFYIPIESLFKVEDKVATVFIVDEINETAVAINVEIVSFLQDEVIVRGDLNTSSQLINLGAPYLKHGSRVIVVATDKS